MRVLIIADDLTGALDSAVALTGAGLSCVAARRPADVAAALAFRPDALAVSTASREGSVEAARAAVAEALAAVGAAPEIVFKKIDSRLKGHVAAEAAEVAAWAGLSRALVAPAIPAQGRRVAGGRLMGAGVAEPLDVTGALAGSGLSADAPDTATEADLDAALARALAGEPRLLVGAAGLAGALARSLGGGAPPVPALTGPVLFAIGSRDPITLAQLGALEARAGLRAEAAPEGNCPPALGPGSRLIRLTAGASPFDPAIAGPRFAEGVAALLGTGGFGTLLGCGGETADAILGALGAGVLRVEGEFLPGVPVSTILGLDRPIRLLTKSGGFGAEDTLARVAEAAGSLENAR